MITSRSWPDTTTVTIGRKTLIYILYLTRVSTRVMDTTRFIQIGGYPPPLLGNVVNHLYFVYMYEYCVCVVQRVFFVFRHDNGINNSSRLTIRGLGPRAHYWLSISYILSGGRFSSNRHDRLCAMCILGLKIILIIIIKKKIPFNNFSKLPY